MEDRYLFKAKDCNSIWRAGLLIGLQEGRCAIEEKDGSKWACNSKTICQCTGLKDKNGKLIWENDICIRIVLPTKRIKTNFKIAYVPYKCCISAIDLDGSNITFLSDYINNQYEVEVIGNIFDNKELLESEDKDENNY